MSKGRKVPLGAALLYPHERLAAARKMKAEHGQEMIAAAALLPKTVKLQDGRMLRAVDETCGGLGYTCLDGMHVIASYDPSPHGLLLHVSVSYAKKDPRWNDLRLLRDAFFPDHVDVVQVFPRRGQYVNAMEHCFHLFQAPGEWQGGWNV